MRKSLAALLALALACALLLGGCMPAAPEEELRVEVALPEVPKDLERDESGVPLLRVYDTEAQAVCEMDIETYVMGVLAGEMNNSWPQEALKAQAILARTFVLKFIETKESSYPGADISTDVREAQAYSEVNINENVRTAVEETRGEVVSYDAELVQAWFHAHAGGMTELPSVALEYKQEDPPYLVPTSSNDSPDAPQSVQSWTAKFDADAFAPGVRGHRRARGRDTQRGNRRNGRVRPRSDAAGQRQGSERALPAPAAGRKRDEEHAA